MSDFHDSSNQPTMARPLLNNLGSASAHSDGDCCKVAMCKGSSPHLSKETQSLLRSRLRIAALLLGAGFGTFFVRQLFTADYASGWSLFMLIFQGLVTVTLLLVGGGLCHKCSYAISTLRIAELVIFGVPALFFVFMQWLSLMANDSFVVGATAPWMLLILVYSLYIPNTWKRAAIILSIFAIAPVVIFALARLNMHHVAEKITTPHIITLFMTMTLAAVIGAWGVHTIHFLRREAFEAKQLGQYKLKRLLGAGGMGEVHLAEHQLMKRPVAIKLIKPGKAADPVSLARFEREVRATAQLSHWNTIEIFDYGHTDDGTFYYVMEYLPGKSLADLVAHHGPLAPSRVVWLLEQTCEALAEAHSLGLIHRDIKPGNIFAAERGGVFDVAKLLDFGLAKAAAGNGDMNLTQEGSITGSPLFMAPEQATGDGAPDARSDIYALGAVGYYLLTGHAPFEADNPVKVLLAHAQQTVKPPSQLQPGIPADVERIILRCLEKNPNDRFPDVTSLADALRESSIHGHWTRADAHRWWTTNGGVDHSGQRLEIPQSSSGAEAHTHDSAASPTAVLAG
jgi:eukaryotic-like serine/threonine-protein kinase